MRPIWKFVMAGLFFLRWRSSFTRTALQRMLPSPATSLRGLTVQNSQKIAWEQNLGPDGLIHPGKFIQVELMAKDATRYMDTDGWGWGRWRGLALRPYGENAHFVDECTGCHAGERQRLRLHASHH